MFISSGIFALCVCIASTCVSRAASSNTSLGDRLVVSSSTFAGQYPSTSASFLIFPQPTTSIQAISLTDDLLLPEETTTELSSPPLTTIPVQRTLSSIATGSTSTIVDHEAVSLPSIPQTITHVFPTLSIVVPYYSGEPTASTELSVAISSYDSSTTMSAILTRLPSPLLTTMSFSDRAKTTTFYPSISPSLYSTSTLSATISVKSSSRPTTSVAVSSYDSSTATLTRLPSSLSTTTSFSDRAKTTTLYPSITPSLYSTTTPSITSVVTPESTVSLKSSTPQAPVMTTKSSPSLHESPTIEEMSPFTTPITGTSSLQTTSSLSFSSASMTASVPSTTTGTKTVVYTSVLASETTTSQPRESTLSKLTPPSSSKPTLEEKGPNSGNLKPVFAVGLMGFAVAFLVSGVLAVAILGMCVHFREHIRGNKKIRTPDRRSESFRYTSQQSR